jgi:aspartate-semialdehyde dehydrogenase
MPLTKLPVAVLGATGPVGQKLVALLANHPWFGLVSIHSSERTSGSRYFDAIADRLFYSEDELRHAQDMILLPATELSSASLAFSALSASAAREVEPLWLQEGRSVCSNASAFRMHPNVPIVLPGVNSNHVHLVRSQREACGWNGYLVTNSNCSVSGLVTALAPLEGLSPMGACCSTYQSLSGAGWPGHPAVAALANVIPYIAEEEAKVANEARKILGSLEEGRIADRPLTMDVFCARVPVAVGHLMSAHVWFNEEFTVEQVISIWESTPAALIPSAPASSIVVRRENDRPQPSKDVRTGGGFSAVVGRVRKSESGALAFAVLVDNLVLGAAGAALMNGELLAANGYLG